MSGKTLKRKHQEIDRELKLLEDKLRSQDHKDLLTIYNKGDDIFYVKTDDDGEPILMDMETDTSKSSSDEYKQDHIAKRAGWFEKKELEEKRNLEKTRKGGASRNYRRPASKPHPPRTVLNPRLVASAEERRRWETLRRLFVHLVGVAPRSARDFRTAWNDRLRDGRVPQATIIHLISLLRARIQQAETRIEQAASAASAASGSKEQD